MEEQQSGGRRGGGVDVWHEVEILHNGIHTDDVSVTGSVSMSNSAALQRHYALLRLGHQSDADAIASAHQFLWPEIEEQKPF